MSRVECWTLSNNISVNIAVDIFTLSMTTAMFTKTLDNVQHSTRLTPESRSFTSYLDSYKSLKPVTVALQWQTAQPRGRKQAAQTGSV
jgi:hypothetical protein